jgi:hypothetical protein
MPDETRLDGLAVEGEGSRRTIDMGTMSRDTEGLATAMPPTALVIETAGVRTPSAIVSAVPKSDCAQRSSPVSAKPVDSTGGIDVPISKGGSESCP